MENQLCYINCCQDCKKVTEDLNSVFDDRTMRNVWVCDTCAERYGEETDPDCMID